MDERERRMAQNEAVFRAVNERVEEIAVKLGDDGRYQYFCECANTDCTFRFVLSVDEYEAVRSDSKQFVVLPSHFTPEIEKVVRRTDSYWVVRKPGEAGQYVEHLDPRSRSS